MEAAGTRSLSVLVVDDEAPLRSTVSAILESAGHRVVEAEDGLVALSLLNERAFDLVVLDLYMPKLDGVEVLRRIHVPPPIVIVYSAFAYYSLRAVFEEVGSSVFRFVQKPVPPLDFIAAVNDAVAELDR
jgi:CheY-like chemotaxis protein